MEHFPGVLSRAESDAFANAIAEHFDIHGFGLWALEVPGVVPFAGFVGLTFVGFAAPFTPSVEIGWRLVREHWGRGYATEAARAAMTFGFASLELDEIVAFTVPKNDRRPLSYVPGGRVVAWSADSCRSHPNDQNKRE